MTLFDDSLLFFRLDLLQISHGSDNDTLIAKATNVGSTVLKVGRSRTKVE